MLSLASAIAASAAKNEETRPIIAQALPNGPHATKVIFSDKKMFDFKYIWVSLNGFYALVIVQVVILNPTNFRQLRDNCHCDKCVEPNTRQKLLDTPLLDVNITPKLKQVNEHGQLVIVWSDDTEHVSVFDPHW